ncbi:TetR/AcrR family transcriptional regulator [Kibdelosporangium phytohabitans]|uniref:TetR family transcriptional regulator n=1 Tax=Kibdelosporangium phytohabitans TaxID=860235 RepID=A0A0N9HVB0_9PSEU|nr:TetR/AcrR family transcriptional regulator [Kibdelosporangium phytohabitans]ALG09144.1 TetR family transcriptional regulator [Kibdelosporangium phytohabitans]MBE1469636.1 AcrR family transcriptional regulator [Kibdelosporangium phytohabitans]
MTTGSVSPRRADTRRNNERIIAAAKDLLTCDEGLAYNAIAKKADVGVGTVYRHFPTPESLVIAVYQSEVRSLVDVVPTLLDENSPEEAFRTWTGHFAAYMMTKRGLGPALHAATRNNEEDLLGQAFEAMLNAVTTLVNANVEAGRARKDLNPKTVLRVLGCTMLLDQSGDWKAEAEEVFDLLWKGLRAT